VRKLTTANRLLAEGKDVAAVCRELGVSEHAAGALLWLLEPEVKRTLSRLRSTEQHSSGTTSAT